MPKKNGKYSGPDTSDLSNIPIITGVIGVDAHIIGSSLLTYALQQAGFKVHKLGTCVSQEEFINAAIETGARAIAISSLYGMGILDCKGLREKCVEAGIGDILLYAGGNLAVGEKEWDKIEEEFKLMGFTRAYPTTTKPQDFVEDLKRDLGLI